ncbi:zona pellucida sperm-binding protein 4-like [Bombina bombina]|uniref:zona pellucida sperm-binding protein 4-like n=1 Tax=Bombina bombina TaxID=8345 RepID=UPI00235A6017|nr:zona pellucida sperm-binding protein 4-like [Bombina bombina]
MGFCVVLWVLGLLLSCKLQCLVCEAQTFWEESSQLRCGLTSLQFSLPSLDNDSAFFLKVLDNQGESHYLHNSSECGTWVGQEPDGSVVVGAAYDGCYVTEQEDAYLMTILLKEALLDGEIQHHKKELKCPVLPAMDAPSPDVCAAIARGDRVSCANAPVSRDLCESLGCCFTPLDSSMPCYYGNKVTAQCTADNQVIVALAKDVTVPPLILDSVNVLSVNTATCSGLQITRNNLFAVFQFPLSCGSGHMTDVSQIYENVFEATRDVRNWQGASITRDSTMKLTVRCSYSRTSAVLLNVDVVTLPPPPPVSTTGPLSLEMRIAQDVSYTGYYVDGDYPVVKVLRDPVYLEVRILRRTDPNLVLILNDCWATQSTNSFQQPQWPVLEKSCPFTGDNYLTQLIPVVASQTYPTHYQRFSISTFTFVDERTQLSLGGLVYFHCSASVCVPSNFDSCRRTCSSRKRRMVPVEDTMTIVTSEGPIYFASASMVKAEIPGDNDSGYKPLAWARGTAVAGGVMAIIFIIGVWNYKRFNITKSEQV